MTPLVIKAYSVPPVNKRELLRYAGVLGDAPELSALVDSCISEAATHLRYMTVHREIELIPEPELSFIHYSAGLRKNLAGCHRAVIFAATVGVGIDRLIRKYSSVSPTRSLILGALGAERIESLCDAFSASVAAEMSAKGLITHTRFSPGYGDLPLEAQKELFSVLDCQRSIGLTLCDSLLMSPTKSVTAVIGLETKGK